MVNLILWFFFWCVVWSPLKSIFNPANSKVHSHAFLWVIATFRPWKYGLIHQMVSKLWHCQRSYSYQSLRFLASHGHCLWRCQPETLSHCCNVKLSGCLIASCWWDDLVGLPKNTLNTEHDQEIIQSWEKILKIGPIDLETVEVISNGQHWVGQCIIMGSMYLH